MKLHVDAWRANQKLRSFPLNRMVSTSSTAPYYSPKAENFSHNCADLTMVREAAQRQDVRMPEDAWRGAIADVRHKLLLGRPRPGEDGQHDWFHALFPCKRSAMLVLPGTLVDAGFGHMVFEHKAQVLEPVLLPLFSFDGWLAATFQWRSWLWHATTLPIGSVQRLRVLPVLDSLPSGVMETMAKNAFWTMPMSDIVRFSSLCGVVIEDSANLCEAVLQAIKDILKVSDS